MIALGSRRSEWVIFAGDVCMCPHSAKTALEQNRGVEEFQLIGIQKAHRAGFQDCQCPAVLSPNEKLTVELVCRENLETALSVLFSAFPDDQTQRDILKVFDAYAGGEINFPSLSCEGGGIEVLEQFIFRDEAGMAVAVGGLYKELQRPEDDVSLNWVGVRPEARRKGYGLEVLQHLEQFAAANGFEKISVWKAEESPDAPDLTPEHRMYLEFGMKDSSERFPYEWKGEVYTDMWLVKRIR